jgi:hypothetical protein
MEPFHEDIWNSGVRAPGILFIGTKWSEWSASRLDYFSLGQGTPVPI